MGELIHLLAPLMQDLKPAEFTQNLALFTIAWYVVKKTVNGHFKSIEDKLQQMSSAMNRLESTLSGIETSHSSRLAKVEDELKSINSRLIGK